MHRIICSVSWCTRVSSSVVGRVSRNSFSMRNVSVNWWFQNTVMGPVILATLVAHHSLILTMCNSTIWISHVHYFSIMEVPIHKIQSASSSLLWISHCTIQMQHCTSLLWVLFMSRKDPVAHLFTHVYIVVRIYVTFPVTAVFCSCHTNCA
jgi:hypothetical protein